MWKRLTYEGDHEEGGVRGDVVPPKRTTPQRVHHAFEEDEGASEQNSGKCNGFLKANSVILIKMSSRPPMKQGLTSPNYHRLKYFDSIRSQQSMHHGWSSSFLSMPTHLINPDFFIINYQPSKKISSVMTIFTIWNTMVGSSLLTLPWAFAHGGLFVSFIIALICGLSSMYTCLLIVGNAKNELDFGDTA